jgi:hypothetical protein
MTHRIQATHFDDDRMIEEVRQLFERYRRVAAERERRFARRDVEAAPPGRGKDRGAAARPGPSERRAAQREREERRRG